MNEKNLENRNAHPMATAIVNKWNGLKIFT